MGTKIKCKKDLFNNGKCFTKGKTYHTNRTLYNEASLMDVKIKNDLNEMHIIGSWWRNFKIVK